MTDDNDEVKMKTLREAIFFSNHLNFHNLKSLNKSVQKLVNITTATKNCWLLRA